MGAYVSLRSERGGNKQKDQGAVVDGKIAGLACIQCARDAGYNQLELNVVAENNRALSLYRSLGFVEFGQNPKGFNSQITGYQELIYMLLPL